MKDDFSFGSPTKKYVCVGTGLIALDVIPDPNPVASRHLLAGGSCGNVLSILAYLGWQSNAVGRIGNDVAGRRILADLNSWNVKTSLVEVSERVGTPVYVEHLKLRKNGIPSHRFQGMCPDCHSTFPQYRPLLSRAVSDVEVRIPETTVFYSDRISSNALELSNFYRERGAIIMFEPTGVRDAVLFQKCLETADILKYSEPKGVVFQPFTSRFPVPLEIETMGGNGLRYRLHRRQSARKWLSLGPSRTGQLIDSSGAGDWCSAGLLHVLGGYGVKQLDKAGEDVLREALTFGQILAGLNCGLVGARGLMYRVQRSELPQFMNANELTQLPKSSRPSEENRSFPKSRLFCRYCSRTSSA